MIMRMNVAVHSHFRTRGAACARRRVGRLDETTARPVREGLLNWTINHLRVKRRLIVIFNEPT